MLNDAFGKPREYYVYFLASIQCIKSFTEFFVLIGKEDLL